MDSRCDASYVSCEHKYEDETMIAEPRCHKRKCKHFTGVRSEGIEENERVVCLAFPNEIPNDIAYGKNPHRSPYPGDNGIRYERES